MSARHLRADEPAQPSADGAASGTSASALWHLAVRLATASDISTALRRVVEAARAVSAADAAAILLYDPEQDLFMPAVPSVAVGLDERWLQRQGLEGAQLLARQATEARDVLVVPATAPLPEQELPQLAGQRPVAAVWCRPPPE